MGIMQGPWAPCTRGSTPMRSQPRGHKHGPSLLPPSPSFPGRSTRTQMRGTAPSSTLSPGRAQGLSSSSMRSQVTSMPPSAWTGSRKPSTHCGLRPVTGRRTSCWSLSQSSSSRCRTSTTASHASWRGPTLAVWLSCPLSVGLLGGRTWIGKPACLSCQTLSPLYPAKPPAKSQGFQLRPKLGSQKGKINKVA